MLATGAKLLLLSDAAIILAKTSLTLEGTEGFYRRNDQLWAVTEQVEVRNSDTMLKQREEAEVGQTIQRHPLCV